MASNQAARRFWDKFHNVYFSAGLPLLLEKGHGKLEVYSVQVYGADRCLDPGFGDIPV